MKQKQKHKINNRGAFGISGTLSSGLNIIYQNYKCLIYILILVWPSILIYLLLCLENTSDLFVEFRKPELFNLKVCIFYIVLRYSPFNILISSFSSSTVLKVNISLVLVIDSQSLPLSNWKYSCFT